MKKTIGIILFLGSLVLLVLGLIYPFMTFKIDFQMKGASFLGSLFGASVSDQINKTMTYNIPDAMKMLFKHKQYFVGVLIGLFAVVLPVLKTILISIFLFTKNNKLYKFIGAIGKFAMADVFCVGIFIAFLYTRFNQALKADIEIGYYYFASYVLISIASMVLLKPVSDQR